MKNQHVSRAIEWLQHVAPAAQLSSDSRTVTAGDIFFAYPGDKGDGRNYIENSIQNGTCAVVFDSDEFCWNNAWAVPHYAVAGLRQLAGEIASQWYGKPDAAMFTVAVTGTNGKTSCAQWLGSALSRTDEPAVVIGTLGVSMYKHGEHGAFHPTGYTTPDAVLLQRRLAETHAKGAAALAIEASSIGLHQGRLAGMHFDAALFTNFTRDHLDYHGDMAAYEAAKTRLFEWPGLQHAVINLDDAMGQRLIERLQLHQASGQSSLKSLIGYTINENHHPDIAVLQASDIRFTQTGTAFRLESRYGNAQIKTHLVGLFNVSNVLGILGILLAKGISWKHAVSAIEQLTPVPGRMQQFGGQDAPLVVIDYAHSPDALQKTLETLRQVAQKRHGKLWCVFGCGGERDPGKRPQMGAIALQADKVIVTSDNPRSEDPEAIIAQILSGMSAATADQVHTLQDRAAAILWAVRHAAKPDVILLAGKGHESTQEVKGKKLLFMDADHAALALSARVTMKGAAA